MVFLQALRWRLAEFLKPASGQNLVVDIDVHLAKLLAVKIWNLTAKNFSF